MVIFFFCSSVSRSAEVGEFASVVDLVYRSDGAETPVAGWARGGGAHVVDGIEVLVRQGALSFELWTGRPAPLEAMRAAARSARA